MQVFCGDDLMGEVRLKHGMHGSMVNSVHLAVPCSGQRLSVLGTDAAPDRLLRVCGISMFS
jgi:hypothetical protein